MPTACSLRIASSVPVQPFVGGTFTAQAAVVAGHGGTFTSEVSTAVRDSWDGPCISIGVRVKLGGAWVPADALEGKVEIEEAIDRHSGTASFTLRGGRWSVLRTIMTWTRVAVEIWIDHGPPGAVTETMRFGGYVLTCDQANSPVVVKVRCGDWAAVHEGWQLCDEVAPLAGLTRGEIVRQLAEEAGIEFFDVPDGAVYGKPVAAVAQPFFGFNAAFIEPEGWRQHMTGPAALKVWRPELARHPSPSDHVWTPEITENVTTAPPQDVASRWVVRGTSAVEIDEAGVTVELTKTVIEGLYAPLVGEQEQSSDDGSVSPTGLDPESETLRVVQILIDSHSRRGERTVWRMTDEYGWMNPAAARLRTPNTSEGAGDAPGGYHWTHAYIDGEGNYRSWARERFVLVGRRIAVPTYDVDGNETAWTTKVYRYDRRRKGVATATSDDLNVEGAGVGDDEMSYQSHSVGNNILAVEQWGEAEEQRLTYHYAGTIVSREVQETHRYESIAAAIDVGGHYLLYDGSGQTEIVANKRLARRETVNHIIGQGMLRGDSEQVEAYAINRKADGEYDWGNDVRSDRPSARFQVIDRNTKLYNPLSEESYEEVLTDKDGTRVPRLILGRMPTLRYKFSPWTRLVQQPIEVILTDPTLEAWFGPRKEVLQNDFVQSVQEATALLQERRRWELAHRHEVVMPIVGARIGQTVHLVEDCDASGLDDRCLLWSVRESYDVATGDATASYEVRQPIPLAQEAA